MTLIVSETNGHGLCCFMQGGELPHVGGVVLANPSPRLHSCGMTCDLWSLTLPGHKDVKIAQMIAKQLCQATGQPVSVTAGLHIADASEADIQDLCNYCLEAVEHYIDEFVLRKNEKG